MILQNLQVPWDVDYVTFYEAHVASSEFEVYGGANVELPVLVSVFSKYAE